MRFSREMSHLPSVPLDLIKWPWEEKIEHNSHRRVYTKDGRGVQNATFDMYPVQPNNAELHDWIVQHVYPNCASPMRLTIFHNTSSSINGPHTDTQRVLILNYFLDLGGDDVWTTWYRDKTRDSLILEGSYYSMNYNDLEPLERVKFEKHKWYLLNGRVPHSIDGMTGSRLYLSLCFLKQDLHLLGDEIVQWFLTNSGISNIEDVI